MKKFILAIASLVLFAACSDAPQVNDRDGVQDTRMEAVKIEQKLELDGCEVTVYKVHTGNSSPVANFNLATAKCPTAEVISTQHSCGKNCTTGAARVVALPASAPVDPKQAKIAELEASLEAIQKQVDELKKK